MKNKFDFNDINLLPKLCVVDSRSECDTTIKLGNNIFKLPIIPSNMRSVINEDIAEKLAKRNYFYVMHRFDVDIINFVRDFKTKSLITSISIGVNTDSYELLLSLKELGLEPDYITIDIAHGHSHKMEAMLTYLKSNFKSFIIAGNICTTEGIIDLETWGADAIKIGIAPGLVCTTNIATGFGSKNIQAYIINECAKISSVPIIADGGIRTPGDITKALVMGASMVMCGSLFSGQIDSPGDIELINNKGYKKYWGSASENENKKTRVEGTSTLIEIKNRTILEEMTYLEECLQSSISYAGGNNLLAFDNVKYII